MKERLKITLVFCFLFVVAFSLSEAAAAETKIVVMTDTGFIPQQVTLKKNEPASFVIHNQGRLVRKMIIPGLHVSSPFLMEDEMATIRFLPTQTGRFPFHAKTSHSQEGVLAGFIIVE